MEWIEITLNALTVIALFWGLYLGNKGLKRYLIDDIIKRKTASISEANQNSKVLAKKIINKILEKDDIKRPADIDDVIYLKSLARKLKHVSLNSSSEVHTLAFLLYETIKDIQLEIKKDKKKISRIEGRSATDFYILVLNVCYKIEFFAGNVIDVPKSTTTKKYDEINKKLKRYLDKTNIEVLKGLRVGTNIDLNSPIVLIYFTILKNSVYDYIFYRKFFMTIRNNYPVIYHLFVNDIYFPPIITHKKHDKLFGKKELHLINIEQKENLIGEDKGKKYYELVYSNLDTIKNFVDNIGLNELVNQFQDSFIKSEDSQIFTSINPNSFKILGEKSLSFQCENIAGQESFKKVKKTFKKKLKEIKNYDS